MAEDTSRKALGRGLAALIGDMGSESAMLDRARSQRRVPIEFLRPNPRNPRKTFNASDLDELAASVRDKGIVQPILVRRVEGSNEAFEIIAGERRWRAAQLAKLHEVPVLIHDVSDKEALELAIIENVQRSDLNALEEAMGYEQLIEQFGYTQAQLADSIGKSRPHVANTLRLLKLPADVRALLHEGKLTAGHARALINAADPSAAAAQIVAGGLTVRASESLARPKKKRSTSLNAKDADTVALQKALSDGLGLKVVINHKPSGAGEVRIRYSSLEQLDDVCRRLQD